jgi:geranylgeranyl diphosphate synthase type I
VFQVVTGESTDMASSSERATAMTIDMVLARYRDLLRDGLRDAVQRAGAAIPRADAVAGLLDDFYAQIEYHLGWRLPDLTPTTPATAHTGKLLRPALVLFSCDLAAGHAGLDAAARADLLRRIVPAAVCIELVHNFSLIHDDIEDGDEERHHYPTLWKLWGVSQAINTGDGLFSLARMGLWQLADAGIDARIIVQLASLLDRTCLELCEGQYLDMRYEGWREITVPMYLEMIGRKTAALMACATGFGALLAAPDDIALHQHLASFGRALGIAFQLRDDLLGVWEAEWLGKTAAGDLRRKKMSLPVIHALETAAAADRATLERIYATDDAASETEIAEVLAILDRTGARARVRTTLREQGAIAHVALREAAGAHASPTKDTPKDTPDDAYLALATLLDFVLAAE